MLRRSPVLFLLLFLDLTLVSSACAAEDTDFQKIQSSFLGKWKGDLNVGGTVESEWFKLPTNFICAKVDVDSPIGKDSYILIIGRDHEALKIWYHKSGEEVRESTVSWDGDTMVSVGPPSKLGLTHFFYQVSKGEMLIWGCPGKDAAHLFEVRVIRQKDQPGDKVGKAAAAGATP